MLEKPEDVFQKPQDNKLEKPGARLEQTPQRPAAPDPILNPDNVRAKDLANEVAIQDLKDNLSKGLAGGAGPQAPKEEPKGLSAAEVRTKQDFRLAMEQMKHSFTDPTDLETNQTFCRFFFTPELASYYLMKDGDKPIGVELIRVNPNVPDAMYTPYAGIDSDYRNQGIYPKAAQISDEQMRQRGKDHVLYEFEDKRVLKENVYPTENPDDVLKRVEGRQNFWKRSVDCHIVNDPDVPYCRPASDDPKKIQAYDSLAFRTLDKNDPKWNGTFNADKTAISRGSYEKFYLEIMQLEYGAKDSVPTKEELRREYPAIDKFFAQLEAHPEKQWISIDATKPREKATPNNPEEMRLRDGGLDQRARWQHVPRNGLGWERPLTQDPERQKMKEPELTPMTEEDMHKVIRKIAEAFGTDTDPTQAPPSVEQFKGLQNIDPYSLLLQKDTNGEVIGWSGMVPVSRQLAENFVQGKINEAQIIAAAIEKPGYDALYHWAFYKDPNARNKGGTIDFSETQFKKLMERHPTIQDHVAWGYSEEGAQFMHRMEQDLGIRIRKSPGSF